MLLYLSLLGILLSIVLVYHNAREFRSSVFLGLFFFLISTITFNVYVLLYSKSVYLVAMFNLVPAPTSYLVGPTFYWYIRSILTDETRLKKSDIWHFIPAVIFLVAAMPYYFSPWAHKIEIATRIVDEVKNICWQKPISLYTSIPPWTIHLSRPILILAYVLWSLVLFVRHRKHNKGTKLLAGQYLFMDKWLIVLFSCIITLAVGHAIAVSWSHLRTDLYLFYTMNMPQLFSIIGLTLLLVSPFFFPSVLYGFPRFHGAGKSLPEAQGTKGDNTVELENKKDSPDFEEEYLLGIARKLESCMNDFQPYLNPGCNLAYCARLINIPSHHLAYYFREVKGQTFTDYRNQWRVNHAKMLINSGKNNDYTIEAIGMMSGFSSRDAFIASFKKQEGIPPSVYATSTQK